jgi:hypothetical protein
VFISCPLFRLNCRTSRISIPRSIVTPGAVCCTSVRRGMAYPRRQALIHVNFHITDCQTSMRFFFGCSYEPAGIFHPFGPKYFLPSAELERGWAPYATRLIAGSLQRCWYLALFSWASTRPSRPVAQTEIQVNGSKFDCRWTVFPAVDCVAKAY